MAWKILAIVVIVAALALAGYLQFGGSFTDEGAEVAEESKKGDIKLEEKTESMGAKDPSGNNIDEVAAVAAADADTDASLFSEETGDTSLLDEDSQAVGDFGGIYNESEF